MIEEIIKAWASITDLSGTIDKEILRSKTNHKLYLVILSDGMETFLKIGVTSQEVEARFQKENTYKLKSYFDWNFADGVIARGIESLLQERLLPFNLKYKPKKYFSGYSECYQFDSYLVVKNIIENTLRRYNQPAELVPEKKRKTRLNNKREKEFEGVMDSLWNKSKKLIIDE